MHSITNKNSCSSNSLSMKVGRFTQRKYRLNLKQREYLKKKGVNQILQLLLKSPCDGVIFVKGFIGKTSILSAVYPQLGHRSNCEMSVMQLLCWVGIKRACSYLGKQDPNNPAHLAFLLLLWAEKCVVFFFLIVTSYQETMSHSSKTTNI